MVRIGHTIMTEQAAPRALVAHVVGAERAGSGFVGAGCTEIALIRIGGGHQRPFLEWSEKTPPPALRPL
ncbi:hypothetical protein ACIRQP_19465 [Streptomyces sp. NPDC102274]|uniref:hypothetical protein n=1 Tax=Streptomyces sp. NPDC102274 TaxID=3366151 RepID=UPI00380AFBAF